jgi:hypothetical protein
MKCNLAEHMKTVDYVPSRDLFRLVRPMFLTLCRHAHIILAPAYHSRLWLGISTLA